MTGFRPTVSMCAPWAASTIPDRQTAWTSTSRPDRLNNCQLGLGHRSALEPRQLGFVMREIIAAIVLLAAGSDAACAASSESLGTDVAIALPLIAGGITLAKEDWKGSAQLTVDTIATVGIAYGLK